MVVAEGGNGGLIDGQQFYKPHGKSGLCRGSSKSQYGQHGRNANERSLAILKTRPRALARSP